uniref:Dystonin n=1 Tax=Salmo trutta TaxID=8032 RepID=A0A674CVA4_SALTR
MNPGVNERDRVQKKTFTKWINQHLLKVRKHVNDLYEDLRDGHNLISLLEVLTGQSLPREKGRMRFHRLQNVQIALDFLKRRQVKLVNIRNDDITDGNPKLTLGLIWTIILHFQISEIHVCGESEDMTAKERLLMWSQQMTEGYVGVRCDNFTSSWRDGRLFNAIIHKYRPDLVDMARVSGQTSRSNLEQAFSVAERLGVARLLDPEDVDVQTPDEKSVITYVSTLYDVFPKVPDGVDGINANDVDIKWVEYQNMVNYLSQWLKHNVAVMSDRAFPNNPVELKALYTQYLQFKENEIPLKETEKSKIKHLYKMLEVWIEFGRIHLPQGYHPNDVEKEWGKLIVAMLEREKSLRPEVDRLEMLQQIATRVQRDCVNGEDKLALARAALQSDAKRLESGVQFQNEAETAGHLLECENLLRQQVVDIQILLDGKYYYSDQLVQRCKLTAFSRYHATHRHKGNILGMAPGDLQHLKQMQIRKPLCKSLLVDPNMTEDEVNINFVQDLINWVEEMQVQLDRGDWGSDLPSVETHLENHKGVHRAIEEFQMSLKEAKLSEIQMTQKLSYSEKLGKLETQYGKLQNCSRERQKNLESLHDFVSRATMELIWLNEKEEEEVAFDWSDLNGNISKKRQYHSDLMRELDEKEEVIKSVQDRAENLLQENHPARLTIEAYKAAMQTQWSWILQLCSCVEQHLKDNTVYFEFFNNAKESTDYLKSLQGDIQRKYCCDRTSSVHKLEDHIQESMDEKEQLLQYRSTVAGLVGKAKAIVQLKPRNPDTPVRSSIPIKAICDYRQIEITIYKDDECVLASNSHRAKWKVISPSGNEAMVPSVCFTVPPPNKEAVDQASRIEQLYQNVLALWHHSHIKMKSVVSWHYLMADVRAIRDWNTMLPGEHQQVLSNLQSHFEDFLEDSKESEVFTVADCSQLEREVLACKDYYEELLKSAEREEHEESVYNLYISEVRNFRMRLEAQEEHLIRQIRTPLDRDDLEQSVLRITEQEKKKAELDQLKDDLETMKEKCETFFRQAGASPAVPTLSSDLNVLIQSMSQVYSMSAIYLEKLKTVSLVVRHSQSAEALVKLYEAKLSEEDAVNSDLKSIDTVVSTLKQWRSEIDDQREIFHDLEDGLQKARGISERMFKAHNERDFDLDWHKEKADQLEERWNNVHSQIESRLVFSGQLLRDRLKTQEKQPEDSKALAELVNQQKVLVAEMEQKQSRIDECQKYSEQYSSSAKDYELQLLTYRAMVDSQHKSPLKRRRMQNSADAIVQEFMDLRTRYTALVTSMTQYVKFASETLKRAEGEEVGDCTLQLKQEALQQIDELHTKMQQVQNERTALSHDLLKAKSQIAKLETEKMLLNSSIAQLENIHKEKSNEVTKLKQMLAHSEQKLGIKEKDLQGLRGSISIRKLIKTKLLDRETLQKLETGLVTLEEVQASLAQFIGKPTAIAGVYLESSKKKISFLEAADRGLLAKTYAIEYMEAQAATGCIIDPSTGQTLSVQAALEMGIVGLNLKDKLMDAEKAATGYVHGTKTLSVYQAMEERIVDRHKGKKIIEAQIATGGLVHPVLGVRVPVNVAVDEGLLNKATLQNLYDPVSNPKGFHNPDSGQKTYYCELLKKCLYDTDGGVYLLPFGEKNLSSFSFCSSHRLSVINSALGLESEWQEKSTVDFLEMAELVSYRSGLISIYELADLILSRMVVVQDANSPVAGLWDVTQKRRVTILQGHQQSLIDRLTALRLLEAQACTGGICDPASGEKAPVAEALRRGLLDETFARQLQQSEQAYYGIVHPQTAKTLSVAQAIQENLFPKDIGLRCLEFQVLTGGLINPETHDRISLDEAVQSCLVDKATLITSGLVLPQFRMCLELDEAFHHNLIDEATWKQLRELNEANRSILSPPFSSEPLPVMAALREGAVSERLAMKVIEIQLATGGLRVSYTGDVLTLERAFQFGLIPAPLYVKLLERQNTWKDLINPGTAEKVSLTQLVQRSVVDEETGLRLLPLKKSHNGSIELTSGREMSVLRAVHEGLIDRETTLRLLGAQLFAGGIADPKTGCKLTVEQALSEGLIDQDTAIGILSQQVQNGGIVNPQNGKRLTVDEAVQCDLMSFSSALLVLEKQKGLMGLLWPHSGEILTVSTSLRHKIITSQLAFKLLSNRQKIASLYIPEYSEVVDINSATQNGFIDVHTAEVLKTIEIPDVFPDVDDLNDRFSNWLMLRELQIGGSHRTTDDNEIDYENINTPSPIEAKQLFISYLTMNSYMDPKSGQRLLIFDGQLTKMAELLVDISVETTENQVYSTGPGNATFEDMSLKEDISEDSEMSFDSNTEDFGYLHINEETDGTMKDHHASNFFKEEESDYKQSDSKAFSNNVVKVVAHDGTEDSPSAIDCVNNTTQPDSDISIYQRNTSSISLASIGIDQESSDNQSKETFTGSSATQTPSTDMSLPSGAQDCKMMIAHNFTEKLSSSVKSTRQHDSVLSDGPSPFEIGLETSDKALYNQPIGESATHAMSESSTRTKSCSVSGKDISLLAQRVTDEASVAVHSEKNAGQPDSKDNVLSNSIYQKTRHGTSPSSFEIGVETSEISSDYQPQETVNGVSASETVLESSAPPRLCLVNDTDMCLSSGAKDSKKVVAKGLTEEASVEVSSFKNTSTSPVLTQIGLVTSETYSDNQPKDTANGGSATQTIVESSTPRFCSIDSEKTIQQSDSEANVSKKKKINNTSIVPFEIDVETSHINSDNQPQEALTFNEGSATQILLERSTHPLLCSVNDTDRSFPSAAPDSKRMPAQKEYSSSENNAQHSKMEVAHGFTDKSSISIDSEKNTRQPSFEMGVVSDRIYQTNTMSTSPTPFKMDSETDIASDNQPKGTFNGSSATQTGMETNLSVTHRHLEDTAFDIQYFISEHAQFLSPAQSRHLLKSLSATQRAFKEQTERVANQRRTLERHLEIREDESQQKVWTQITILQLGPLHLGKKNRLIGHQQQTKGAASVEDLQHVQQEHQALQKDILTNGSALNEVISSTKKFLDENRSKLTPDQIIAIESKLDDAKSKVKLINQRAEESRKDLEKSVTTAIKQETEKEVAVEQLEESKNKIESLLDWINNMGNEKGMGVDQTDHMGIQNGNMPLQSETSAHHQEILSQQQELIMATQSAQALLDHQAHALSPTDKDKLQRDIQELKGRYDSSLTQAEQQMKQVVQVQEELKKFQGDCEEFEGWLQQAEGEVEELGAPAGALNDLTEKLQRQKSFSEDVISHKGDLRFITISGQKVLDVAKACGRLDPGGKDAQLEVDTTATCAAVKEKLDSAAGRFKALHSQCNDLGNNLRDVVDKYKKYEDSAAGLLKWLNNSEEDARRQQSEAIAADPQTLQKHIRMALKSNSSVVFLFQALEQDISSRQSSISAMKAKVKKFVETADPAAAALLQSKMDTLSQRFSDACDKHKHKQGQLEQLKDKVEEFEKTTEKVQQFVLRRSQALSETDGPGKNVNELSQLMQVGCNYLQQCLVQVIVVMKCNLSKLMVVQQNMSYINEGHKSLGEVLKGRATELSVLVQEVTEAQKETDTMITWLQDMKKTAASWNSASTEKDTMKTQLEQQKVDSTKASVCIECFYSVLLVVITGCAKFKLQGCFVLTSVCSSDAAWADVSGSVEDRKQCLEESNRNLDVFQTTETQLRQWLSEKDMMLSVLGPLSMDPNMLNTQKQQVQILLNEFDSRKPQFDQLHEAAAAILSTSSKQDPSSGGKVVKDQLATITQKWQGLTGQLGQRAGLIDQAVGKSSQFQDLLMSLSQSTASLETRLNSQQALSSQPDVVKKQLEEANTISGQLREERKRLKEAETLCSELSSLVTEDYLKAGLDRQLEGVNKPFKQLEDKAGKRIQQLNSTFASSQQFHQTSKDFQGWMNEKLQEQSKLQAISAQVETLRQSLEEQSALQKALSEHEEPYSTIVREGETLLQNTDGAEKMAMQGQLATLRSNWDDVKKSSAERQDKLQGALQRAQKYHEHAEKLQSWVQECEAREGSVRLSVDPAEVESSISQLTAIQKDVDKHRGLVEQLNTAADSLLEVANADTETVREEKAAIGQSVDRVTEGVQNKRESLEKISQRLKEFNDTHNEAKGQLAGAKKQLDAHTSLGVQAYSNKNLTNMKAQQKSLDGVNTQVEHLKSLAQGLVADVPEADGVTDLLLQADSLEKEHGSLSKDVGETCSTLEGKLQGIGQFQTNIREMFTRFADLDDELDSMASVGRDLITLKEQQGGIKDFVEKLQELMADTARGGDSCKKMLETEASPDLLGLKRDLDALSKQCGKLMDRAKGRGEEVGSTLTRLDELYSKLQQFTNKLGGAEVKEEGQGSVGMETDVINQQLEAFKVFQKEVDPLQSQLQDINWLGQGLIQNADKGTSTKGLELDLEDVNTRWNTLNKKIAERSAQLHEALLHCGRFQDALESLLSWLTDTEDLVSNQKHPSAEFKVVKAQIQEQILLQRLLDDRRPTVELIKKEGGKVAELGAESVDKEKVGKEIECLGQRWDALLKKAENRHKQLKSILVVAQQFHETLEPLSEWLSATEKHLAKAEPIGTQTTKLEEQISQHKALHEDIELRKQNVDQAISNGLELLKQTTGDEVVVIQGKLDGIKMRYAEINSMSDNVSKTLDQALTLASKLQHTHEDLSSWLKNVEAELTAFTAQAPVGEQLVQAQDRQKALLKEARDHKPQVDKLNEVSSSLLELVPWRAREGLDKIVTEDNDRYKATSETIAHHVEQIDAAILKSQQFEQAADTELAWLTEAQRKMLSLGEIRLEQDQTTVQLQAQKGFSMDIMRHKDAVDGIVKTGQAKIQALLEKYVVVSQLNSDRCLQLERAQSLASQFWETYEELWPWLQETRTSFSQLPLASIEYEALRQQQEELRQMRELIAEHKPYIDKMNKTGPQLLELSPVAGVAIREKYTATDQLYAQLKADVKQRAFTLDEAISKSTQFHDKIEPMLESLERIAERLRQPPSISVEVEKIREQITENKVVSADLEKLQPSYDTLKQRGEEMIARSAGADKDISAKAVQDKLDRMVFTWNEIHALMEEREAKLLDVMDLADKFWCDHCALIVTIKDTQDLLRELEEPGVDPSVVKQQQEYLESFKEEIDGLQEELDVVRNLGAELMAACGEPDKPVTKKSIDEVNLAWETLNKAWKERVDRLDEAMQAAVQFQDGLQGMFDWVDIVEHKLGSMSPVGTDLDTVKQQIEELKEFKGEAYQLQMEMERLNHQAGLLLKKVTEEYDRCAIQEPMTELKMLWDNLDEKIINRQHKLEGALLALGQFQHALDELLAWMSNTEELLNEQRKAVGDPKAIEIKLAKHHVLQNDVLAHKTTVEAVNKAGTDLVESTSGEEAAGLQNKLENLTQRWKNILEKTEQRRKQLDSALLQAQGFHGEIEDMQQWLKDTERQLLASKAVGGLPDTAREQLNAHLELCSTMEAKEELYQQLMNKGQQLLTMTPSGQDSNTEQDLRNLQDKWESVQAKVAERKVKLEEALALATEFHNSLQDFINWLTQAEQTLTMSSPASLILETILFQIDEHKVFVTEVNSHRQQIIELDKTGTHLKYFSQKQDVVLIKNLLISVQGRWEKVVQRSVERGRLLDDTRKRAKQFHETWNKLTEWLDDSEKALDSELEIANDPDKIKTQLAQHKEFQKVLGSKHSVYDTTSRTGRALKDKTSLQDDNQKLDDMLSELRDKWDTVCGKSVERQNKLEEALLFSGQFTDALQALIDWLYRVEPQLAEDQPVHGDIDLVLNLIDSHKVFQKELGKRTGSVAALKRSAKDLIESSHEDSSWVKAQMQELSARWETVCARSVSKQTRLEQALSQAEEFHSTVHMLLEWLAEAEQSLRFHGTLPDDEEALGALIEQHKEFMKKQEEKRVGLNKATSMGEAILTICHPDSITTIKHWNTIIKARFEEVQAWARQHQQRLAIALSDLLATKELLEGLLGWLQWAETTLNDKDKEVLPQEIDEIKALIAEHQTFMEEMTRKQPDVDKITKTHKRKAVVGSEPASQSHIPVLEKGRGGRKRSPTQAMYPSSQPPIETKNPRVNLLVSKWQQVWLLALDRRRKLNDAMDRLEECLIFFQLKEFANFDFDVWRKRYMRWMNHKKSRVMDFFRRIDKDQDGKVTRQEFIEGILSSKFPTSRLEMSAVADIFDRDGDGYIDYYEFVAALHPNKEAYKPLTDADKIEDEVTRQVAKCKCPKRFQVEQIGANKYRFYLGNQFGDSQQLRLVRILRSTVMVRVGGGWMALDEFLVKNDPCRAKGRTNMELREKFILPEGTTQVMASFRYRGRRSRPSSRAASPNRSNSNHSCPAQHNNPALTSTPKVRDVHDLDASSFDYILLLPQQIHLIT